MSASRRIGILDPPQEEMIHRALDLENISVREIMVPRPDIFSLPADMPLDEALERVVDEQHSRVPVYDTQRGPEHIIGVLYAKDLHALDALPDGALFHRNRRQPCRCAEGAADHAGGAGSAWSQSAARTAGGV